MIEDREEADQAGTRAEAQVVIAREIEVPAKEREADPKEMVKGK